MIYKNNNIIVPQDKREDINNKILSIINNNDTSCGITKQDIYDCYTGNGSLHNYEREDYSSYQAYAEAKQEIELGQFFTSGELAEQIVNLLDINDDDLVGDLTCGKGSFFNYIQNQHNVYGCEIDPKVCKVAKYLYPDANIVCDDIKNYTCPVKLDIIIGNPPFNIDIDGEKSQFVFLKKCYEALKPGGFCVFIILETFLEDEFLCLNQRNQINEMYNFLCQMRLPDNAFNHYGIQSLSTKLVLLQKKSEELVERKYNNTYTNENTFKQVFAQNKIIYDNLRNKFYLASRKNLSEDFAYKYKKLLYQIECNPKLKSQAGKCKERYNTLLTQTKPDGMKQEEWDKMKMTENKVINPMRKLLKNQHITPKDEIRLVKYDYGIKYKAYSNKSKKELDTKYSIKSMSFNNMILEKIYPFGKKYFKLYKKKEREYINQSQNFDDVVPSDDIVEYLNNLVIHDYSDDTDKKLNDIQKTDIGKILSKKYSILNWSMGAGKSLAAYAWFNYHLQNKTVKNAIIVSHPLAINNHWCKMLKDYVHVKTLYDFKNIKYGDVILISFHYINKLKPQLRKFIRKQSNKIAFILDESDEITSESSKRTKNVLSLFRRCKFKLLTTGTVTRNNITEAYKQLELLYNNSINFLCECDTIYSLDKENNLKSHQNDTNYMQPFKARGGAVLFKNCFNPIKTSVFGVNQNTQDVYNPDELSEIIKKTVITRTFKEIVGEDKYEFKTITLPQTLCEQLFTQTIMQDFRSMVYKYFQSSGNSRKESLLMIIRQLQTLIKASSIPQAFCEYAGGLSNKSKTILEMVDEKKNEKFCIGCTFKETVKEYYKLLSTKKRPIFIKTGDENYEKTNDIIKQFNQCKNGILICTQQSLKSAVNIPNCKNVIIESLQWNLPKILQFAFRFVRFNSTDKATIYFLAYDNSIELNILALLLAKEKLNEFIKTQSLQDDSNLFSEYDVDMSILDSIIQKVMTEDGYHLEWGKQLAS